jgi:hypothetical protein
MHALAVALAIAGRETESHQQVLEALALLLPGL